MANPIDKEEAKKKAIVTLENKRILTKDLKLIKIDLLNTLGNSPNSDKFYKVTFSATELEIVIKDKRDWPRSEEL